MFFCDNRTVNRSVSLPFSAFFGIPGISYCLDTSGVKSTYGAVSKKGQPSHRQIAPAQPAYPLTVGCRPSGPRGIVSRSLAK